MSSSIFDEDSTCVPEYSLSPYMNPMVGWNYEEPSKTLQIGWNYEEPSKTPVKTPVKKPYLRLDKPKFYETQEFNGFKTTFLKKNLEYTTLLAVELYEGNFKSFHVRDLSPEDFKNINVILTKMKKEVRITNNAFYLNDRGVLFTTNTGEITPFIPNTTWQIKLIIQGYKCNAEDQYSPIWKLVEAVNII